MQDLTDILEAQELRAQSLLPPGRTLAGEYLRLLSYIGELNRQVVRGTELRIAAEKRAGQKNVNALEERIEAYEEALAIALAAADMSDNDGPWHVLAADASPAARELLGLE